MDKVPPLVHEEVVRRPGLGNVEELQTLLLRDRWLLKIRTSLCIGHLYFNNTEDQHCTANIGSILIYAALFNGLF